MYTSKRVSEIIEQARPHMIEADGHEITNTNYTNYLNYYRYDCRELWGVAQEYMGVLQKIEEEKILKQSEG